MVNWELVKWESSQMGVGKAGIDQMGVGQMVPNRHNCHVKEDPINTTLCIDLEY